MPNPLKKELSERFENIALDVWQGYPSQIMVRNHCEAVLKKIEETKTESLIIDLRQAKGTFIHSANYLKGFFRQLHFLGVRKTAFLVPRNQDLIIHALDIILMNHCQVEFQLIYEEAEALEWFETVELNPYHSKLVNCNKLVVQKNKQNVFISFKKIVFVAADGHNCNVHSKEEVYRINLSLKELNKILPGDHFQRIHKSYIVNTSRVKKTLNETPYSYIVLMEDLANIKIPIGKKYLQKCKRILGL